MVKNAQYVRYGMLLKIMVICGNMGGRLVCKGWYKKGETIHKKWYSELLGENI